MNLYSLVILNIHTNKIISKHFYLKKFSYFTRSPIKEFILMISQEISSRLKSCSFQTFTHDFDKKTVHIFVQVFNEFVYVCCADEEYPVHIGKKFLCECSQVISKGVSNKKELLNEGNLINNKELSNKGNLINNKELSNKGNLINKKELSSNKESSVINLTHKNSNNSNNTNTNNTITNNTNTFTTTKSNEIDILLHQYQNPESHDILENIQKELKITKELSCKTLASLLERNEKLEDLVEKSEQLSSSSKIFYKAAHKRNRCC